jgi:hypothetical protein
VVQFRLDGRFYRWSAQVGGPDDVDEHSGLMLCIPPLRTEQARVANLMPPGSLQGRDPTPKP